MSDEESPPVIGPEATGQNKVSGLAITSLICALLIPLVGLILAIVALLIHESKPAIGGRGGSSGFESIYTYFYGLGSGLGNCSNPEHCGGSQKRSGQRLQGEPAHP